MGILNLSPTWEIPDGSVCIMEATDKGIYMYAAMEENMDGIDLVDGMHAFITVPWQELYTHDDKAREVFLRQKWLQLLEDAKGR